jgi:hypothetical protein
VGGLEELQAGDPVRVGPYVLLGRLGAGGMGRVFLGRSPGGRLVAVKLIRPELAADAAFRARFGREIEAARKVGGMFTAPVVDADPRAAEPWLVTAYVPGASLADAVARQGPLPVSSVLALAAGLAEGLQAVHGAGLVHRDLKPSNVLLASDGPRIIDFGISRALEGTAVTRTDQVVGSPGFMSPEQADGREAGPASDVFSLGSVLAFAATGEEPFGTGPATALLYRVVHSEPSTAGLPGQLRQLIERCLAKDPDLRPTPSQVLAELGAPQLAADWLPPAIGQVVLGYELPDTAIGQLSQPTRTPTRAAVDGGLTADPATVTTVGRGQAPGAAQPPQMGRRRHRTWAWAVGALAAILAITATAVALTHMPTSSPAPSRTSSEKAHAATPRAKSATPGGPVRPAATQVIAYEPWAVNTLAPGIQVASTVKGSCWTSSGVSDRSDAYRCLSGNNLFDPCFASPYVSSPGQVACPYPSPESVTVINLTKPLPLQSLPGQQPNPWLLDLANGQQCFSHTGAVIEVGGMPALFSCGPRASLLGKPQRSNRTWTIYYQAQPGSSLTMVPIAKAYE